MTLVADQFPLLPDALIAAAAGAGAMAGAGATPGHHSLTRLETQASIVTVPLTQTKWSLDLTNNGPVMFLSIGDL